MHIFVLGEEEFVDVVMKPDRIDDATESPQLETLGTSIPKHNTFSCWTIPTSYGKM